MCIERERGKERELVIYPIISHEIPLYACIIHIYIYIVGIVNQRII